jgi:dehydrogenase/reductase SDR family member 12
MGQTALGRFSMMASAQWYVTGKREFGVQGYRRAAAGFSAADDAISLEGKHAMVTGANSGVGFAAAAGLAKRGATVHMVCRSAERGEAARQELLQSVGCDGALLVLHIVDCGLGASLKAFASAFVAEHGRLDVLVNNAGALPKERSLNDEGAEVGMAIALGGTYLLTGLLLPALVAAAAASKQRARVINVSSGGMYMVKACPDDLDMAKGSFDGTAQYCRAKRAQQVLTERWAERLAAADVPVDVHCMHPGWSATPGVKSSIGEFYAKNEETFRDQEQGADTMVWLATAPAVEGRGGLFWLDRTEKPAHMRASWTRSSPAEVDELWEACAAKFDWQYEG